MAVIALSPVEPDHRTGMAVSAPVEVGIILPPDTLSASDFDSGFGRISEDEGSEVDAVFHVTSWWDETQTSVKWLHAQFSASTNKMYILETHRQRSALPGGDLAQIVGAHIDVNTGTLEARIPVDGSALLSQVSVGGLNYFSDAVTPMHLVTATVPASWYRACAPGTDSGSGPFTTTFQPDGATLVETNPLRATITGNGVMAVAGQGDWCRVEWRLEFFRDEQFCRLFHTMTWLRRQWEDAAVEISVEFPLHPNLSGSHRIGVVPKPRLTQCWPLQQRLSPAETACVREAQTGDG